MKYIQCLLFLLAFNKLSHCRNVWNNNGQNGNSWSESTYWPDKKLLNQPGEDSIPSESSWNNNEDHGSTWKNSGYNDASSYASDYKDKKLGYGYRVKSGHSDVYVRHSNEEPDSWGSNQNEDDNWSHWNEHSASNMEEETQPTPSPISETTSEPELDTITSAKIKAYLEQNSVPFIDLTEAEDKIPQSPVITMKGQGNTKSETRPFKPESLIQEKLQSNMEIPNLEELKNQFFKLNGAQNVQFSIKLPQGSYQHNILPGIDHSSFNNPQSNYPHSNSFNNIPSKHSEKTNFPILNPLPLITAPLSQKSYSQPDEASQLSSINPEILSALIQASNLPQSAKSSQPHLPQNSFSLSPQSVTLPAQSSNLNNPYLLDPNSVQPNFYPAETISLLGKIKRSIHDRIDKYIDYSLKNGVRMNGHAYPRERRRNEDVSFGYLGEEEKEKMMKHVLGEVLKDLYEYSNNVEAGNRQ